MNINNLVNLLNDEKKENRLNALSDIKSKINSGEITKPEKTINVNNHIHTTYSFSPYSPTKAVYMAYMNGLVTAGIMDHDSVGGAKEFIEAGKILEISATVGIETRVDMSKTKLNNRRINNPDQSSVAYVALHGIPHQYIDDINGYFAPFRKNRNTRNKQMCENISEIMKPYNIKLDFDEHVLPLSQYNNSGSVTERHITCALSKLIAQKYNNSAEVLNFLKNIMKLNIAQKAENALLENNPDYYLYDIIGILKAGMVEKFYVDAYDECPNVEDYIKVAKATGAIPAYAYLGDVGDSVTGDKKPQKFEDDFLELVFEELVRLGFKAVTYMPTRNTKQQLERVIKLCEKNNLFQISGEDINSPRQSFICEALHDPMFSHLIDSTWALINHETAATKCDNAGMFSEKIIKQYPDINERVKKFADRN
ncbi:MAG: PHP domain-containing protein [Oscillospiraceae bacterium]|nr:PHP domain-containing protein [Oscillospiraceae bacterium]